MRSGRPLRHRGHIGQKLLRVVHDPALDRELDAAIVRDRQTIAYPDAYAPLTAGTALILIGDHRGEEAFFRKYRD